MLRRARGGVFKLEMWRPCHFLIRTKSNFANIVHHILDFSSTTSWWSPDEVHCNMSSKRMPNIWQKHLIWPITLSNIYILEWRQTTLIVDWLIARGHFFASFPFHPSFKTPFAPLWTPFCTFLDRCRAPMAPFFLPFSSNFCIAFLVHHVLFLQYFCPFYASCCNMV